MKILESLGTVGGGAEAVFWTAVLLLAYVHLGYPAVIYAWGKARRERPSRRTGALPHVSVLVVAHNEEGRIDARLQNLLSLDYPRDRLEIVLASDGSTDGTVERARAYQHAVRVVAFARRRGKAAVLSDLVPSCRGEVVVLADARQSFDPGAVQALARGFADPEVGAVSGELVLTADGRQGSVGDGVGLYWRCEKMIRASESRVDSTVGATGAIYALRRELFEPIPADTILDDVLIPLHLVRRGYRVLFEPAARAYDRVSATPGQELTRKARTIAGNFQLFVREPWLLSPLRNRLWFQTVSHKGLRLLMPALMLTAFAANALAAAAHPAYQALLAGQVAFYSAALAGHTLGRWRGSLPLVSVPYVVCLLSWATVLGFLGFVTHRQSVVWQKASAGAVS